MDVLVWDAGFRALAKTALPAVAPYLVIVFGTRLLIVGHVLQPNILEIANDI